MCYEIKLPKNKIKDALEISLAVQRWACKNVLMLLYDSDVIAGLNIAIVLDKSQSFELGNLKTVITFLGNLVKNFNLQLRQITSALLPLTKMHKCLSNSAIHDIVIKTPCYRKWPTNQWSYSIKLAPIWLLLWRRTRCLLRKVETDQTNQMS